MLILTRKVGESIIIGPFSDEVIEKIITNREVSVTYLGMDRGRVRIGVTADKAVGVDREEVRLRKSGDKSAIKDREVEIAWQQREAS